MALSNIGITNRAFRVIPTEITIQNELGLHQYPLLSLRHIITSESILVNFIGLLAAIPLLAMRDIQVSLFYCKNL